MKTINKEISQESIDILSKEIKGYTTMQYFLKRVTDFLISIPLFIFSLPVSIYSIYRIKKESPDGPIFFKQQRVGRDGKEFTCYKFRSMIPEAEKNGIPKFASNNEPRIFKWGALSRIDELPQLLNVFKGDMHLIGPRAECSELVKEYEQKIPNYHLRHIVAPGITGWAQVNYPYGRNIEDTKKKLEYDLYYIKNWSLWLEFKTIIKTILVVLGKKGL